MTGKGGKGWRRAVLAAALAAVLCTCARTSAYGPAASEGSVGYRETALPNGHYLVSFTGTLSMDLEEVRRHARRRAAEITLREGHTHFVIFSARSEADIRVVPSGDFWNPENGFLAGYINRDTAREREPGKPPKPWVGDPGRRTRYTAFAEIALLRGRDVANFPDAMAAEDLLAELADRSR